MGKIQLCDGQVHGNDVDESGWSEIYMSSEFGLINFARACSRDFISCQMRRSQHSHPPPIF